MNMRDVKTTALVLRRTNYGEADRILNIITPEGKKSVIAKSVRKEKSKLAGNVEMFSLIEMTIHQGKSEFGVVTGARMQKFFGNILSDLGRMELASMMLKKVSLLAEHSDNPEHFEIAVQVLEALDNGMNLELVEAWFLLNYLKSSGEDINLYRDVDGEKLQPDLEYEWSGMDNALMKKPGGAVNADTIKLMRLMLSAKLIMIGRVKNCEMMMPTILRISRAVNRM